MDGIEATHRVTHEQPKAIVIGLSMHCSDTLQEVMRAAEAATCVSKDAAADQLAQAIHTAKWLSKEPIKATRRIHDKDLSGCISSLFFGCLTCKRHLIQSGVQSILRGRWSDSVSVSRNTRRYLRPTGDDPGGLAFPPPRRQSMSAVVSDHALTRSGFQNDVKENNGRHHSISLHPIIRITT